MVSANRSSLRPNMPAVSAEGASDRLAVGLGTSAEPGLGIDRDELYAGGNATEHRPVRKDYTVEDASLSGRTTLSSMTFIRSVGRATARAQ